MTPRKKPNLHARRRNAVLVRIGTIAALTLIVIGGLLYVVRLPEVSVRTVVVKGAVGVPAAEIQKLVEEQMSGTYWLLVPRRLTFVLPTGAITKLIMDTYPEVQSVALRREGLTTVTVQITERAPGAEWCDHAPAATAHCFDIDKDGLVFSTYEFSEGYRWYYGGISTPHIGSVFLDGSFPAVHHFITQVEKVVGTTIRNVTVTDSDLFLELQSGGEVRVARKDLTDQTLGNIQSVFDSAAFTAGGALEYADFRFGGKALVKYKK